ncbi:MAG: metallophosphoesterase [Burkholderiaceae bacterium]
MTALVHLSDLHFGTERPPVVEALVDCVRAIAPELVVLSGDITQRATAAQFAAAARFVDRLGPAPRLVIPGNHDIPLFDLPARFHRPYARHRAAFGDELEPVYRSADWLVIGVKTTRRWRHRHGQVSTAQIRRVNGLLRQSAPRQLRIVVVHQPVAVPQPREARNVLRGHRAAIRAWSAGGADLIIGGHIHLPGLLPLHERDPGLARRTWCLIAGTAVSARVRPDAGNSFNVVRADGSGRQAIIERWDYLDPAHGFERVATERILTDRGAHDRDASDQRAADGTPGDPR